MLPLRSVRLLQAGDNIIKDKLKSAAAPVKWIINLRKFFCYNFFKEEKLCQILFSTQNTMKF